jgi:hypothetical protein
VLEGVLAVGEVQLLPLAANQGANIEVTPGKGFDFGAGDRKKFTGKVKGGVVGLLLDARGRPITIAQDEAARVRQLQEWAQAAELYPGVGG